VAFAKFCFAVDEQLRESAVDVAETEEAEVVGVNMEFPRTVGYKPDQITAANAALRAPIFPGGLWRAREIAPLAAAAKPPIESLLSGASAAAPF